MSDVRVAGWLGAEQFVTPVEERIDHAEAKRIAEAWLEPDFDGKLSSDDAVLARAYLDLLTEHSAREEAITALLPFYRETRREVEGLIRKMSPEDQDEYLTRFRRAEKALAALPATESAQPEEDT